MNPEQLKFWYAMGGIIIIAVAYEAYPPLGLALFAIAIVTMLLASREQVTI